MPKNDANLLEEVMAAKDKSSRTFYACPGSVNSIFIGHGSVENLSFFTKFIAARASVNYQNHMK